MPKQKLRYNAGMWNMKVGRDHGAVRKYLVWLLTFHRLKVLLLQEAAGYERLLDNIPGYTCFQFRTAVDSNNVAILVSDDLVGRFAWVRTMKRAWFGAKNGIWRKPRSFISVRAGRVRWVDWHRVAYLNHEVNRLANQEIDRKIRRWVVNYLPRRVVIGGDANQGKNTEEMQKLLNLTGLNARGNGIDWWLFGGDGLELRGAYEVEEPSGSDHQPKVVEVVIG